MSSSTATPIGHHPITEATSQLGVSLAQVADTPAWGMSAGEQASVIVQLTRVRAGLEELWLRVQASADRNDVGALTAASSTTAWLAHATTRPPGAAHADVKLAEALDGSFGATRDALAAGVIDPDRARVITHAVHTLPEDAVAAEPELPARAETHLLDLAEKYDARKLKALARHLLEVLDPDGAEERLGRQLEAEEATAARATSLEIRDNGDGTHTGRFKIGTLHAAMLKKMLGAILDPARSATGQPAAGRPAGDQREGSRPVSRPRPEQYGQAFGELLERFPADRLPTSGGVSATVVITLDINALMTGLGTATLDTGEKISAASPAACPVRPESSPPSSGVSSTAGRWSSTWAANAACTRSTCGSRSASSMAAAPLTAVPDPRAGATPITTCPGSLTAPRVSPMAGCCAATTTPEPTMRPTR